MRLKNLWKVWAIVAAVGAVALLAAACGGGAKAAQVLGVDANTVIGSEGVKNPADICIASNQFQQGQTVVWRIKVYDPVNGQPMNDNALDSVVVSLKDGQNFTAKYGGHPGQPGVQPTDYFWSTAWAIPNTYPTGSVPYTVSAKGKDGRSGNFAEFNVGPSLLTVVAAQPPAAQSLIIDANTVAGAPQQGGATPNVAGVCVLTNQYKPGNEIVWRIKVYDPLTGKPMDDKALKSVEVSLKDGQKFDAKYGPHPGQPGVPPTDYFWDATWLIPANYPTGSLPYQVTAQGSDGRTGTFTEFNIAPSLLTVVAVQ
jgi:hypothetical protein